MISTESVFTALANETRLRCLLLLVEHQELCVCELTHVVGAAQPNVSRHLAQLREAGLVIDRREGQWIYYSINPRLPEWVSRILQAAVAGTEGIEPYKTDSDVLAAMSNRRISTRCA